MKAPTTKLGNWKIKYIQVPYDNRYYVFDYEPSSRDCRFIKSHTGSYQLKIPCGDTSAVEEMALMIIMTSKVNQKDVEEISDRFRRYRLFEERVEKKNKLLDKD